MMKVFFAGLLCLELTVCFSEDPKYPVSAIPEELRQNVDVVFREDHMVFKILARNKCSYYVHQVITILNAKGKDYASEVVGYDKLSKIRDLNGTVYDANGKQIKRLKNSDIYDQSAYDGFSLYSDNRFKAIDLAQGSYPYTVEFEYEVEQKYLFAIPSFVLLPDEKISVERSSYTLQFPPGLDPRYHVRNLATQPEKGKTPDGLEYISWKFTNIKPLQLEPLSSPVEVLTTISAAPGLFEYESYAGKMNTWNDFGQWIATLNKGRNILPDDTKATIKRLTESASTQEAKVKILYEYLQNKTRYVSIQLGIGGFQPFEASVVEKTGYGDCKALSNYMVSMLETIDIKSNYVLIRAGANVYSLQEDFPSTQFNHAIVMVPNNGDTLWLECTSQTNPFGFQGSFTGDRKALVITDDGAAIVKTAQYSADDNLQSRVADVFVNVTGDAEAKVKTTYVGRQYENAHLNHILTSQFEEQKKWVQSNTQIPTFDIRSFTMQNIKARIPSAVVNLNLALRRLATVSGKRIFLTPNLMNRSTYIPEKVESRKTNVHRRMTYTDSDTIRYHLPEGIYPEFLPAPVKIKNQFGQYEATFTVDQGSLVYVRRVRMNKGVFPPESYNELIDFYRAMNKADNTKLVFLSKT